MNKVFALLLGFVLCLKVVAQKRPDELRFKDRLEAIDSSDFFRMDDYFVWDPSIIKGKDGKFHLFFSRWKKEYGFSGWLTFSEAAHAIADRPEGPYKFLNTVNLPKHKNGWNAFGSHNPRIRYFNGKYYLYYISTHCDNNCTYEDLVKNAKLGGGKSPLWMPIRNNQRVGVAVSKSLNGPWKTFDKPLIEPSGPIKILTVNPDVAKGKNGQYYLIVKGDRDKAGGPRNQALAIGKKPTGPFVMQSKPVLDSMNTEDVAMWYDKKRDYYYAVLHNENIIYMLSSPDGLNWYRASEFEILKPDVLMKDGSRYQPNMFQRPFIYEEDGEPRVLAVACREKSGMSSLLFIAIKPEQ
ncbi:MAG: glycoside hydrolase family protein [Niabella sp.]